MEFLVMGLLVLVVAGVALGLFKNDIKTASSDSRNPLDWEIGPIVNGVNKSYKMPLHPRREPNALFAIDLPFPNKEAGHVHYVTYKHGSLKGKRFIRMRYELVMGADVKIVPTNFPQHLGMLTLYFQRRGDNWSASGKYETYRWWATFATHFPLVAGEHEIYASLSDKWTAIMVSDAIGESEAFEAALLDCERVGFTCGGGDGYGHGFYATGPATLIVKEFVVE